MWAYVTSMVKRSPTDVPGSLKKWLPILVSSWSCMETSFEKYRPHEIDTMSLDYDYRSVMHYRPYMYAVDRSYPTLKPSDNQVPLEALGHGQAEGTFTDLDIEKIKTFYEC
ncbi:hypothetical protein AVEN_275489-1 [Araneus ventricosus]|uniref:Peptidase M12A domain-containing protein n=1 Tax=Araneus ventricosus TaxID=182803 RepID=A0A4Y2LCR4_ARAVE|nr:hypothetical protein AVEN_275489-1 [Araneus ventricosus]